MNLYVSVSKRRKRNSIDEAYGGHKENKSIKYSLDKVFVKDEKQKYELLVKQLRHTYTANFLKMDLIKSYPNLFELLW